MWDERTFAKDGPCIRSLGLVRIFPRFISGGESNESNQGAGLGLCMCHLDTTTGCKLSTTGFLCPQV